MSLTLFSLRFFHPYYANGTIPNLQITPDAVTGKILRRFLAIPKIHSGVFSLYSFSSAIESDFLSSLTAALDEQPLRFIVKFNTHKFYWITDLPLNWKGQIHIASNKKIDTLNASNAELKVDFTERTLCSDDSLGIFELYPQDIQRQLSGNSIYKVSFPPRRLHWMYYLINRSQTQLRNPCITRDDGVSFDPPDAFLTPTGDKALRFSSGSMSFPLQQNPLEKFDLIDRYRNASNDENSAVENTLIRGLLTPQEFQLNVDTANGDPYVYSAMYVYL